LKRLSAFVVVLGLLVVMVISVSVVGASASQVVSGDWQFGSISPISAQPVGDNCIIELDYTQSYLGDLAGTATGHVRIVHLGPCDQSAAEVFVSQGTFTGNVAGASGTFDFQLEGKAYGPQGNIQGQLVILAGTGNLANLHGQITLTGQLPIGGTYSGDIHFD